MKSRAFRDRVVVITGASSGIGEALAVQLAGEGARLVLAARRRDRLNDLAGRLAGMGGQALAVEADVVDDAACKSIVDQTLSRFGQLDVLIANAGISTNAAVQGLQMEVVKRVMEVNYYGAVQPFLHALPHLEAARGQVIVVSSLAGLKGLPTRAAYSASKFALHGFFDGARLDLRESGVDILLACPGFVATEVRLHALRGDAREQGVEDQGDREMQSAADCAREILDAAKAGKQQLIMGGLSTRLLPLLNEIVPGLVDRIVLKQGGR